MKVGRIIAVKTPYLKRLRKNLREVLVLACKDKLNSIMNYEMGRASESQAFEGSLVADKKIGILYDSIAYSICRCHDCKEVNQDAVFFSEELMASFCYPPLKNNEKMFRTFWLCPVCFQKTMARIDYCRKNGYYLFHEISTFDSLEALGCKNLREYDELIESGEDR